MGGPHNKDYSLRRSTLGSPYFGKLPCRVHGNKNGNYCLGSANSVLAQGNSRLFIPLHMQVLQNSLRRSSTLKKDYSLKSSGVIYDVLGIVTWTRSRDATIKNILFSLSDVLSTYFPCVCNSLVRDTSLVISIPWTQLNSSQFVKYPGAYEDCNYTGNSATSIPT